MSLIAKCYSSLGRRRLTSKDYYSRKNGDEVWSGKMLCTSFPAPCKMVIVAELCPESKLDFHFQMQGKTNKLGLLHISSKSFSQKGLHLLSGGLLRTQNTETVWESVLKSPETIQKLFQLFSF